MQRPVVLHTGYVRQRRDIPLPDTEAPAQLCVHVDCLAIHMDTLGKVCPAHVKALCVIGMNHVSNVGKLIIQSVLYHQHRWQWHPGHAHVQHHQTDRAFTDMDPPGNHKHWVRCCQHLLHKTLNVGCIQAAQHSTARTQHDGMVAIKHAVCKFLHCAAPLIGGIHVSGLWSASELVLSLALAIHIAPHEPSLPLPPGSLCNHITHVPYWV